MGANGRLGAAIIASLCGLFAGACGLGVLSRASNPDAAPPQDAAVALTVCDPSNITEACASTCVQTQQILMNNCAECHGSDPIDGIPRSILDYHSLSNVAASSKYPGQVYVVPGDPDHSLLYQRVAILGDMPPPSTIDSPIPRPSVSDISVLREWILDCIPNLPGYDAGPPPDGGAAEAGIGAASLVSCPDAVPVGACSTQGLTCAYSTQTCVCDAGAWTCYACPATQPPIGGACDVTSNGNPVNPPFSCVYNGVTCTCPGAAGVVFGSDNSWTCGVCPPRQPVQAQSCGNETFACSYAGSECDCLGGVWACQGAECPAAIGFSDTCMGLYACAFAQVDQVCSCDSEIMSTYQCSCPAARPVDQSPCVGGGSSCLYGDDTCQCIEGSGWLCQQTCPAAKPTDGASCNSTLSCSFGDGLCYCGDGTWHCS